MFSSDGQTWVEPLEKHAGPDSSPVIVMSLAVVQRRRFWQSVPMLRLTLSDEGEGIAPEVLPRVMNPFFTTRRSTGGAGLGLALAARIAKDHGGRIEIASERGKGTTVRLLVPCLAAQLSDPSPSIPD